MMSSDRVVAVVVTYNRKDLLLECLSAILEQSFPIYKLIIIDNASTDGTQAALAQNGFLDNALIDYRLMSSNTGGAGGFYKGMVLASQTDCSWIWLMDDDTIPSKSCLEELLNAKAYILNNRCEERQSVPISYLASSVYGANGEFMNVPTINSNASANGYPYWYEYLDGGIVGIDHATFVSILINTEAIPKCGLPCKDFFIWGDDGEYTKRLSNFFGEAYMVGRSVAIHKRKYAKSLKYDNETDPQRIAMRHYLYRNLAIVGRYYSNETFLVILRLVKELAVFLFSIPDKLSRQRQQAKIRGYFEGLVQYRGFKDYIDGQIHEMNNYHVTGSSVTHVGQCGKIVAGCTLEDEDHVH